MAEVALDIYYDAACPFCVESMRRVKKLDRGARLNFIDLGAPEARAAAAPRFDASDLAAEIHIRLPDGAWRIGYEAWAAILAALPRMRLIAAIMMLPPIAEIGRRVYRWFAPRRYLISRLLRMPAPCMAGTVCPVPQKAAQIAHSGH